MADSKITALTALTTADPANDMFPIVDVSDTSMAASGTTKRISINNLLAASGTATLASATITGNLTVQTNALFVNSANNRVGFGTLTPARTVDIVGSFQSSAGWALVGSPAGLGGTTRYIGGAGGTDSWYFNALTGGNHIWAFGESTAMTLNSTGLGVGVSPSFKLHVQDNASNVIARFNGSNANGSVIDIINTAIGGGSYKIGSNFTVGGAGEFAIYDTTAAATRFLISSTGNVISNVTGTAPTLATNSQMVFNLTSNTNLRISVRGTDGTTRTTNLTLA